MTKTTTQAAAAVLSALVTLAVVAGMNGIATSQYAKADSLVMASAGSTQVALQRVTIVGHRANA
jgi:hypothetical protein